MQHQTLQLLQGVSKSNTHPSPTALLTEPESKRTLDKRNLQFLGINVRAVQYRRSYCRSTCDCDCHKVKRLSTPQSLQSLFGVMFIGYGALPRLSRCNVRSCVRQAHPIFSVMYQFPSWFVARAVSFQASLASLQRPAFLLRVQKVIPSDSDIIKAMRQRNTSEVQRLLTNGEVSANDVDEYGRTLSEVGILLSCLTT